MFCYKHRPEIKGEHPELCTGEARRDGESHGCRGRAAREKGRAPLKENYGQETAADRSTGKPDAAEQGPSRLKKARKGRKRRKTKRRRKIQMMMMMMNNLVLPVFLFIKH